MYFQHSSTHHYRCMKWRIIVGDSNWALKIWVGLLEYLETEAFWRHVARHPDMSNVVVAILWNRFQAKQGNVVYRHGAGCPRSTKKRDDRLIVLQTWCMNVTPSRKRSFWNLELILGCCDIHLAVVLRLKRKKRPSVFVVALWRPPPCL